MTTSDETVHYAISHPPFDDATNLLQNYRSRISSKLPTFFWELLSNIKQDYITQNNQLGAKAAWCLECIGDIQDNFISAFLHIKAENFLSGWELLEQCENAIVSLDRHFVESQNNLGIEHVRVHAQQLQELYQLKWGVSPGALYDEVRCSICQERRLLRSNCGHKVGDIYNGELCFGVVTKWTLLHISLVDNPAQKSSVIWPEDETQFIVLKQLADELLSPWDPWRYHIETRRSKHPAFKNVGLSDPCPCGSSLKYAQCCAEKDTVPDFPHFQFTFSGETRGLLSNLVIFHVNSKSS